MPQYQAASDLLTDRVILITGASDGFGKALALAAAAHGAEVVLLGRSLRKLEAVYDQIEAAGGKQPAIYPMNLEGAVWKDYEDLAGVINDNFGRLDGLVLNAAMLGSLTPLSHQQPDMWMRVLHMNLTAPVMLTKACMGLLNLADDASVVAVTDAVGSKGKAFWGAYAQAKAGLNNFIEVLADETENNTPIRCNSFQPGPMRTNFRRGAYPGEDPSTVPTPEDTVAGVLYLLGADSQNVTGKKLTEQDVSGALH